MKTNYSPISCSFYDELESLAVRKIKCTIIYLENENEKTINDFIENFETKNKEEFLILKSGEKIRLDKIIKVNKNIISDSCNI